MLTDNFGHMIASVFSSAQGNGAQQAHVTDLNEAIFMEASGITAVSNTTAGFFAQNNNFFSVKLGSGVTPVSRSDYNLETPCIGNLGGTYWIGPGSGYANGEVNVNIQCGPASTADTVRESAYFVYGPYQHNQTAFPTGPRYYCYARYNYTPLPVGIGEVVVVEMTVAI